MIKSINSVNFTGKVYQIGSVKDTSKKSEIKKIQKYSDDTKYDVMLTERAEQHQNGVYSAIVIKRNPSPEKDSFAKKEFNFNSDADFTDKQELDFKPCLSALYA